MPDGTPSANRIAPGAPATARHLARIGALAARHGVRPEDLDDAVHAAILGTASAERALAGLTRFLDRLPEGSPAVRALLERPRFAQGLATLFSGSPFLGEILLQHPENAEALLHVDRDASRRRASHHLHAALAAMAPLAEPAAQLDALRRLQRLEYVRIGYADLAGLWDLAAVTGQLSALAEGLIGAVLGVAARVEGVVAGGLAILALGKLGGGELNYSSDVDLVFLAESPTPERTRLARAVADGLSRATAAGYLYRVDLRLRPWGRTGPLVTGVEAYLEYLRRTARPWERQALLRARTVAGDRALGARFLREAQPLLFAGAGSGVREQVAGQKRRIDEGLRAVGRAWGEVKSGVGSIRDVEFLVQYLQLAHGAARPEVLTPNTPEALARLRAAGLLSADDYRALAEGYTFLRPLEHYLQLLDYGQRHSLPQDPEALDYLARRLGYGTDSAGETLLAHYARHSAAVRAAYERHLGDGNAAPGPGSLPPATTAESAAEHVLRMAPSYRATFGDAEIARHARLAEGLGPERLAEIYVEPAGDRRWRVEVVAYDYAGELAIICGLLTAFGLDIESGQVFTYEGDLASGARRNAGDRRKIVDAFVVRAERALTDEDWARYADDLRALLGLLEAGRADEAHGTLARRVAGDARPPAGAPRGGGSGPARALAPLAIGVRNEADAAHTVLTIEGPDTPGFLYALANALSVAGYYIARMTVETIGARARDVLHITDAAGGRVEGARRERELRAATVLVKHFTHLLPLSPDPQRALSHLRGFLARLFAEEDWPARLASVDRPEVLTALARLLGVSDALWEDLLRLQYEDLFPVLADVEALAEPRTRADLDRALADLLVSAPDPAAARERLNAFKDREMFRVDMRHILGQTAEFGAFSAELGDVAEAVLSAALGLAYGALGPPPGPPVALALVGLGKLGGREMGYASDVELLFVYEDTQAPTRPQVAEVHERLVAEFLATIRSRRAGIFRIDLRLRPYGAAGSLAVSLEAFRRYYGPEGPAWPYERQALVKARAIAGDAALGARVEALRDEIVYGGAAFDAVAMRAMRERQLRHLVPGGVLNSKYSSGGLVDVEYLVQGLQMRHGAAHPDVRRVNTLEALDALTAVGALDRAQHDDLRAAYILLRRVIDALRIVRGNADDLALPPEGDEEWLYLARRMGNGEALARGQDAAAHLRRRLSESMARVAALAGELLGA